jgi:hypothetical protein
LNRAGRHAQQSCRLSGVNGECCGLRFFFHARSVVHDGARW